MPTAFAPSLAAERTVRHLAALADIEINGNRPWDIRVHDSRLYGRLLSQGSLGFGEAYMDGWWDCDRLDQMMEHIIGNDLPGKIPWNLPTLLTALAAHVMNPQTRSRSSAVAEHHYDLGNDLFQAFLDPWMQYSCGYFEGTDDLSVAQEKKLNLIARKLQITPADHVLDIGCGWGGLAKYLAERHGCRVTGVNISAEQVAYAREWCKGLPVEILESDYRDVGGTFSKVVSVGMFEHVGRKNYRTYMETAHRCLADDGIFLLHCIGGTVHAENDAWLERYIFPHSQLPSQKQITVAANGLFLLEDWHNFGAFYDPTLMSWHRNFIQAWPGLEGRYGERFRRMWEYYLLSCAGAFRCRSQQLWQIAFSKKGVRGGYASVR